MLRRFLQLQVRSLAVDQLLLRGQADVARPYRHLLQTETSAMRRCRMDELESLHFICCLSLDLHGRGLLGFDQGSSNRSWLRVRRHDLESVETYSRAHTAKSVQDTFAGGTFVVHEDERVPGLLLHIEEQFDRIRKALSSLLEHYGKLLPSRIAATRIQLTSQAATVQSANQENC